MHKEYKIFGIRPILEGMSAEKPIYKIFAQKESRGNLFSELEQMAKIKNIAISYVPRKKIEYLAKGKNHQGVVATISPITCVSLEDMVDNIPKDNNPLFVLLDGVSDVKNFGAIIRTAECCEVSGIIVPKNGSAPISPDTVKTSAGAAFNIPICRVAHLKDAVFYLQQSGIQVCGITEKSKNTIGDINLKRASAMIFGSEEKGIATSILNVIDEKGKIPILGKTKSLNVSVACGMALYEALRQRK